MGDNELGAFLRARREAVTPAEVGLPSGPRRRTPGLRRAELATLAGISVEYLTRLEQGRDRHPSAEVLGALANALRLGADERFHLLLLSKQATGAALLCPVAEPPARSVRPTVRAVLDRLEPTPALVVNRLGDVLAHTTAYARLVGPVGLLDTEPPNLTWFVFADPRARSAYPDWDRVADERIAHLKIEPCPRRAAFVEDLTIAAGAAVTDRLDTSAGLPQRTGVERLVHPEVGELRLAYETLELSDADDQRLIVYLPADSGTSAALDRLTGHSAGDHRSDTDALTALTGRPG
jgi:transcriptional regulator with XRE-family HTH domain